MSRRRAGSIAALQAENGLWAELWLIALSDAYSAKDSRRRLREIDSLSHREAAKVWFRYNPGMKEWVERHIATGTPEQAIQGLQAERVKLREARAAQRAERDRLREMPQEEMTEPPRVTQAKVEWMIGGPWMLGPARAPKPPAAEAATDARPVKPRGPKPEKLNQIVARMEADYVGRPDDLKDEKDASLANTYGCSTYTARKARKLALDKLQPISN